MRALGLVAANPPIIWCSLTRMRINLPPGTPPKLVVDADVHQLNVSVVAGELVASGKTSDWAKTKGSAVQPNKIVLNPAGPIAPERPLDTEACSPARVAVAGRKGGRQVIDCHCWIACPDPGTAALAINEHPVPGVTKASSYGGQPPIIECHGSDVAGGDS